MNKAPVAKIQELPIPEILRPTGPLKSMHQLHREEHAAHVAAIANGDVETVLVKAKNDARMFGPDKVPPEFMREIRETLRNALANKGVIGMSETVVGGTLMTLAQVIIQVRFELERESVAMSLEGRGSLRQNTKVFDLLELLERANQSYGKTLKDFATAKHALVLGQAPQKDAQPIDRAARQPDAKPQSTGEQAHPQEFGHAA